MKSLCGNQKAIIQIKTGTAKNAIGEAVPVWSDVQTLKGWLDLKAGQAGYQTYSAKVEESTHVFVADYVKLDQQITAETSRAVIDGNYYDVMLIDNPMSMGRDSQLEIFLKYTGGR